MHMFSINDKVYVSPFDTDGVPILVLLSSRIPVVFKLNDKLL